MCSAVCILYTVFCLRGRVDPRWWQCHHSGGHRDQNRMLLWPTSAIPHSPHLQLAQRPDHRNIYLILCHKFPHFHFSFFFFAVYNHIFCRLAILLVVSVCNLKASKHYKAVADTPSATQPTPIGHIRKWHRWWWRLNVNSGVATSEKQWKGSCF